MNFLYPAIEFAFLISSEMCLLKLSSSSMCTLISFFYVIWSKLWSPSLYCACCLFSLDSWIYTCEWNHSSHVSLHCFILSGSFCRILESLSFWIILKILVSSAKKYTVEETRSGRSLMYMTKSRGPSTFPWGSPDVTFALFQPGCILPSSIDLLKIIWRGSDIASAVSLKNPGFMLSMLGD